MAFQNKDWVEEMLAQRTGEKAGRGRGNWGHAGRPGSVGGSAPSGSTGGGVQAEPSRGSQAEREFPVDGGSDEDGYGERSLPRGGSFRYSVKKDVYSPGKWRAKFSTAETMNFGGEGYAGESPATTRSESFDWLSKRYDWLEQNGE